MINVAISILFVVICLFQPWMAVVFLLFWLIGAKEQVSQEDAFAAHKEKALKELDEKLQKIYEEDGVDFRTPTKTKRDRSHLRIVK